MAVRWAFRRKYLLGWLALLLLIFLLTNRTYVVSFDGLVRSVKPSVVWEFVMDFNNVKELNPTILDFYILSDGGNHDEWRYEVSYQEQLHQMPSIKNQAVGKFRFRALPNEEFVIESTHETCFFWNMTCVNSKSQFIFKKDKRNPMDTYCLETVQYECPRLLSNFCYNEVMFQRKSIFTNLDKFLSKV